MAGPYDKLNQTTESFDYCSRGPDGSILFKKTIDDDIYGKKFGSMVVTGSVLPDQSHTVVGIVLSVHPGSNGQPLLSSEGTGNLPGTVKIPGTEYDVPNTDAGKRVVTETANACKARLSLKP